jgi:hypothetical protein
MARETLVAHGPRRCGRLTAEARSSQRRSASRQRSWLRLPSSWLPCPRGEESSKQTQLPGRGETSTPTRPTRANRAKRSQFLDRPGGGRRATVPNKPNPHGGRRAVKCSVKHGL